MILIQLKEHRREYDRPIVGPALHAGWFPHHRPEVKALAQRGATLNSLLLMHRFATTRQLASGSSRTPQSSAHELGTLRQCVCSQTIPSILAARFYMAKDRELERKCMSALAASCDLCL